MESCGRQMRKSTLSPVDPETKTFDVEGLTPNLSGPHKLNTKRKILNCFTLNGNCILLIFIYKLSDDLRETVTYLPFFICIKSKII
jgi:hypothetical protein